MKEPNAIILARNVGKAHISDTGQVRLSDTGHSQFKGHSFCPSADPSKTKEQWLVKMREKISKKNWYFS